MNVVYLVSCSLHNILYPEHCCIPTQLFQPTSHPSQDRTDGETIEMDVISDLEKTSTEVQPSRGPKNQVLIFCFLIIYCFPWGMIQNTIQVSKAYFIHHKVCHKVWSKTKNNMKSLPTVIAIVCINIMKTTFDLNF